MGALVYSTHNKARPLASSLTSFRRSDLVLPHKEKTMSKDPWPRACFWVELMILLVTIFTVITHS
jgi:hypothetical protein